MSCLLCFAFYGVDAVERRCRRKKSCREESGPALFAALFASVLFFRVFRSRWQLGRGVSLGELKTESAAVRAEDSGGLATMEREAKGRGRVLGQTTE